MRECPDCDGPKTRQIAMANLRWNQEENGAYGLQQRYHCGACGHSYWRYIDDNAWDGGPGPKPGEPKPVTDTLFIKGQINQIKQVLGTLVAWSAHELGADAANELIGQLNGTPETEPTKVPVRGPVANDILARQTKTAKERGAMADKIALRLARGGWLRPAASVHDLSVILEKELDE